MWKRIRILIINHLGFSQTEANGFIVLVLLVLLTAIVPRLYLIYSNPVSVSESDIQKMSDFSNTLKSALSEKTIPTKKKREIKIFDFNPNNASLKELYTLGFNDDIAQRLVNYRGTGAKFYTKKDLFKVYGIDSLLVRKLWYNIQLPENEKTISKSDQGPKTIENKKEIEETTEKVKYDINHCTVDNLLSIYGIGPAFSTRIIKYRDLLGGFYSFDQLKEVYNLPDSLIAPVMDGFFIETDSWKKININITPDSILSKHPYIDYNLAKAIKNYQKVHGDYSDKEEIKTLKIKTKKEIEKILPYISVED